MTVRRINSTFCSLPLVWIVFVLLPFLRFSFFQGQWKHGGMVSATSSIIFSAVLSQMSIRFVRVCSAPLLFRSRSQEFTIDREEICEHNPQLREQYFSIFLLPFSHHKMSVNIDMKMILPLNCSGSHFCSFMNS